MFNSRLRYMYQHIMKAELTRVLWVWGPVTQYQISLEGVDSSGEGACDVMEILTREDVDIVSQARAGLLPCHTLSHHDSHTAITSPLCHHLTSPSAPRPALFLSASLPALTSLPLSLSPCLTVSSRRAFLAALTSQLACSRASVGVVASPGVYP